MENKKIIISAEASYFTALVIMSFSVAMVAAADFGVSMIVAPAYILSLKFTFLTFGQAEYVVQGVLFIVFCILMKRVRLIYFGSFITGIIYGAMLDLWRTVVPQFNPALTAPGSMGLSVRVIYFIFGMVITSFAVALLFRTYIYPQVYDFFVKGVSEKYRIDRNKFKIAFDICCLVVSCAFTLLLFGKFMGVGVGTIIMTIFNGALIGAIGKFLDKRVSFLPTFPAFERRFSID